MNKQVLQYEIQDLEKELVPPIAPDMLRSEYLKAADAIVSKQKYFPKSKNQFWNSLLHSNYTAVFKPVEVTDEDEKKVYSTMLELENYSADEDFKDRVAFKLNDMSYIENIEEREKFFLDHPEKLNRYANEKSVLEAVEEKLYNQNFDYRTPEAIHMEHGFSIAPSRKARIGALAAGALLGLVGGFAAAEHGAFVYGANSHPNQAESQYSLQCSPTNLNINIHNDQWNPVWNNAKIINLVNVGGAYNGAGKTGNAFLGLECDQHWLYGFVAYLPPADENGHIAIYPHYLGIGIDPYNNGPAIPQKYDQLFTFAPSANTSGKIFHSIGAGVDNYVGGWQLPGYLYDNTSVIDFHFSITKTPIISLPSSHNLTGNPLYQFEISRDNLLIKQMNDYGKYNEFGMYVELNDNFVVSKTNQLQYYATLPAINDIHAKTLSPQHWPTFVFTQPETTTLSSSTSPKIPMTSNSTNISTTTGIGVSEKLLTPISLGAVCTVTALALYKYDRNKRKGKKI
jgi:hypothetical protein